MPIEITPPQKSKVRNLPTGFWLLVESEQLLMWRPVGADRVGVLLNRSITPGGYRNKDQIGFRVEKIPIHVLEYEAYIVPKGFAIGAFELDHPDIVPIIESLPVKLRLTDIPVGTRFSFVPKPGSLLIDGPCVRVADGYVSLERQELATGAPTDYIWQREVTILTAKTFHSNQPCK